MKENKEKIGIKLPNREEIEQRLKVLAKQDREAVVIFATRCALRVLPLIMVDGDFNYWPSNKRVEYIQSVSIACLLGFEFNKNRDFVTAAAAAAYTATTTAAANSAAYAAANSAAYAAAANAAAATATAIASASSSASVAFIAYTDAASASASSSASSSAAYTSASFSDLIQLEKNNIKEVKKSALWLDHLPASHNFLERVDVWLNVMEGLQLGVLANIYRNLLKGGGDPGNKLVPLVSNWYKTYGHKYEKQNDEQSELTPKEIIRYGQNHAHVHDGLAERDSLGRQQLVNAMADILSAKENIQHQTIGLLGDWGAGKSTFIQLLKASLQKQKEVPFLFAEFNAWEYEHTDHMQAGVAREALKGLVNDLSWWKKIYLAFKLSWQEKPWHLVSISLGTLILIFSVVYRDIFPDNWKVFIPWVGGGIGILAGFFIWKFIHSLQKLLKSPLVNEWKSLLSLPDYDRYLGTIPVMKRQISALCTLRLGINKPDTEKKRFLFVVDDLDRCSHSGVVKTLEAVRLVMEIKQVTVIIAIDQRIALASLAQHYKALAGYYQGGNPGTIARDYLGKVIQLSIQIDSADAETVTSFIDEVLLNGADESVQEKIPTESVHSYEIDTELVPAQAVDKQPEMESTTAHTESRDTLHASPKEQVIEKIKYQLSPTEKEAFKERVKRFGFNNPRQLKRLFNSFNLLRHLYGSDQVDDHMEMLFHLEDLNSVSSNDGKESVNKPSLAGNYETLKKQVEPFVLPAMDNVIVK